MLFAGLFEAGEGTVPELIEFGPERLEAVGIHLVDAAIAIRPVGDQSRVFEHLEVLRYGRPADRKLAGQFADGARATSEPGEDRASRAVAECSNL